VHDAKCTAGTVLKPLREMAHHAHSQPRSQAICRSHQARDSENLPQAVTNRPVTQSCPGHPRQNPQRVGPLKRFVSYAQRVEIYRVLRLLEKAPLPLGPTFFSDRRILPWRIGALQKGELR
jgi:hypothetical protein